MPETSTAATDSTDAVDTDAQPAQGEPAEVDYKAEARKWESRAKANKKALDDATPKLQEYDRLVDASRSDLERAQGEATRWQSETDRWRKAAVSSRVQALAADFADPTDAITALSDSEKYLTAGGEINDEAIKADLGALLQAKPHWRRADAGPRPPAPSAAQGTSGNGSGSPDPAQQFAALIQGQLGQ